MSDNPANNTLLIEIKVKVERLISDVAEMRNDGTARLAALETEKLNHDSFKEYVEGAEKRYTDHEKRIRFLERIGFSAIALLYLVEAYLKFLH